MTAPAWFITGTDTGVGKTLVTQALLHVLRRTHARVVGMKPVAAGAENGCNEDVLALRAASSFEAPIERVNPYLLRAPVSPHIAARREGVVIEPSRIVDACNGLRASADAVLVEGAGGFRVPLADTLDGADLAVALGLPVVLVVGLRLGCLNHALLSAEAIASRGLHLAGWVGNHIDPSMPEQAANLDFLHSRLPAPSLGTVPHLQPPDPLAAARGLRFPP
jgi:dethiobiotin synthetase